MRLMQFGQFDIMARSEIVTPWMEKVAAASVGEFAADHITHAITTGALAGFFYCTDEIEIKGIMIVAKTEHADGKMVMVVVGAAGELQDLHDTGTLLDELAERMECAAIEIKGREGFARLFKDQGWVKRYVVIQRPIRPTQKE